jgi:HSP20 family protein
MTLGLWEPLRTFDRFDRLVDDMFGVAPNGVRRSERVAAWRPAADLIETKDGYEFRFDLPGLTREAIEIDVADRALTVHGERPALAADEQKVAVHRRELAYGRFQRSFQLPNDADAAAISAEYKDGVLAIRIPKAAAARARKVPISA